MSYKSFWSWSTPRDDIVLFWKSNEEIVVVLFKIIYLCRITFERFNEMNDGIFLDKLIVFSCSVSFLIFACQGLKILRRHLKYNNNK